MKWPKKATILNVRILNGLDHSYIDICETDHSKSEPFKNWTLKRLVLGLRWVFLVQILSPHCICKRFYIDTFSYIESRVDWKLSTFTCESQIYLYGKLTYLIKSSMALDP